MTTDKGFLCDVDALWTFMTDLRNHGLIDDPADAHVKVRLDRIRAKLDAIVKVPAAPPSALNVDGYTGWRDAVCAAIGVEPSWSMVPVWFLRELLTGKLNPMLRSGVLPWHDPAPPVDDVKVQMLNALKAAESSIAAVVEMAHDSDDIDALDEVRAAIRAVGG